MDEIHYGDDPSQFGRLYRAPQTGSLGTVVVIHGGFWKAAYDLSLGTGLAEDLVERGWDVWNLEYRRVGNGGGWPTTLDDVGAGIDMLADFTGLDLSKVITLGHSAGGQLAAWSASRPEPKVAVTAVVSQAGVLDLIAAAREQLGARAAEALLGGPPAEHPDRYQMADPTAHLPLTVPVRCVHGAADVNVPISQSREYVRRATDLGADASLTEIDGDHFALIDTGSKAWETTVEILGTL